LWRWSWRGLWLTAYNFHAGFENVLMFLDAIVNLIVMFFVADAVSFYCPCCSLMVLMRL